MTQGLLTDDGRDRISELLGEDVVELAIGSDSSAPSSDATGVRQHVITKPTGDEDAGTGSREFQVRLDTTEANGETLGEIAALDGTGNAVSLIAFADIPKTEDFEIEFTVTKTVVNN